VEWVDPRGRSMDELWEAADRACQWRSRYMSFFGVHANITGKGGWNATVFGGDPPFRSFPHAAAWGPTPRLALGNLIVRLETTPRPSRPRLWFEPQEG
jgi:hypothetical protein